MYIILLTISLISLLATLIHDPLLVAQAACDAESKPDVCARIAAVAARHAPSPSWHIHTLLSLLAIAGNAAKREVLSRTLYLISHEGADGHAALAHSLYCQAVGALTSAEASGGEVQQPLLQAAVWVIGEYGQQLLTPPPPAAAAAGSDGDSAVFSLPSPSPPPPPSARSEMEVVRLLGRILHLYYASSDTKAMVLTSLLKLTARYARDPSAVGLARQWLGEHASSSDVELQSRSVEYGVIASPAPLPGMEDKAKR